MKLNMIGSLLLSLVVFNISAQKRTMTDKEIDSFLEIKRGQYKMLLKDYFLFECINSGLKHNGSKLLEKDRSKLFYETFHTYVPEQDLTQVLNYARTIGNSVLFNANSKKQSLLATCMNEYRDVKLEKITDTIVKKEITKDGFLANPD